MLLAGPETNTTQHMPTAAAMICARIHTLTSEVLLVIRFESNLVTARCCQVPSVWHDLKTLAHMSQRRPAACIPVVQMPLSSQPCLASGPDAAA